MKKFGLLVMITALVYFGYLVSTADKIKPIYLEYQNDTSDTLYICGLMGDRFLYTEKEYTENKIEEAFNYLSQNNNALPESFFTHIPLSTRLLDYTAVDDNLSLNLSEEFLQYDQEYDYEIACEIFFTFYEQGFNRVYLLVNGSLLDRLGDMNISSGINKNIGINVKYDCFEKNNSIIIYYYEDEYIYPVTHIVGDDTNNLSYVLNQIFTFYELGSIIDIIIENDKMTIYTLEYNDYAFKSINHSLNENYLEEMTFYLTEIVLSS